MYITGRGAGDFFWGGGMSKFGRETRGDLEIYKNIKGRGGGGLYFLC